MHCSVISAPRIQSRNAQNLEIPLRPGDEAVSIRVGKGAACLFLGLVDDLPGFGHLDQPRQSEGALAHVLHQTFDALPVVGQQNYPPIHAEAVVLRTTHALGDFHLYSALGQIQGKARFLGVAADLTARFAHIDPDIKTPFPTRVVAPNRLLETPSLARVGSRPLAIADLSVHS